jgi:hypothetical protein
MESMEIMGSDSPFSTPRGIVSELSTITETSTPWSDMPLAELRTTIQASSPPRLPSRHVFSSRDFSKARSRIVWLVILLAIGLTFSINRLRSGNHQLILTTNEDEVLIASELNGMQFIDASHPYIHVS